MSQAQRPVSKSAVPYVTVSSDCHAGADIMGYRPYLESKWLESFDEWANQYETPWAEVEREHMQRLKHQTGTFDASLTETISKSQKDFIVENWDSAGRTAALDADGVVGEVIFPNTAPPFYPSNVTVAGAPGTKEEYELRKAGIQAHNRWLADFCADLPGRRAGVAQILLNDIDDTLAEIRFVVDAGIFGGILLPGVQPGAGVPPLFAPEYEPIWQLCSELNVPINQHCGSGQPSGAGFGPAAGLVAVTEARYFAYRGLIHLIYAGVFERYPNLRYIITEARTGWVPDRLKTLDWVVREARVKGSPYHNFSQPTAENLSMLPSEYFARNCFVGSSLMVREEVEMRHEIGIGKILWGSDYPHSEGSYPYTRVAMQKLFAGVPEDEVRQMLGLNAVEVYGFDLDVLTEAAAAVGPTPQEIDAPIASMPAVPDDTVCYTFAPENFAKTS